MILVTTYYKSNDINRNMEINKCLYNNFKNKFIEKIYLLNDKIYDISFLNNYKRKIIQKVLINKDDKKLSFQDAILFINEELKDKICILANSDIYFDNTLSKITNRTIENNCFALLRYDEDKNGNKTIFSRYGEPRNDSQDSWIFRSPLLVDYEKLNFSFGTLGCDSILCTIIKDSNINISNPCLDIVSTHLHNSNYRTYDEMNRIHGIYTLLKPCYIGEIPSVDKIEY